MHSWSFRRKPESSIFKELQNSWTPVFTGVTTFYEAVKVQCNIVDFLDYILPESLGLICRADLVKTSPYKMSRSSLTLGTLNFRHFRHLNQRTFQDQQKQATSSGGGNLTVNCLMPCIFESLPFPKAVSNFPARNEKDPQKHGDTPQTVPVPGKKSPALAKMDSAFECGLFPPGRAGNHHPFCVDEG